MTDMTEIDDNDDNDDDDPQEQGITIKVLRRDGIENVVIRSYKEDHVPESGTYIDIVGVTYRVLQKGSVLCHVRDEGVMITHATIHVAKLQDTRNRQFDDTTIGLDLAALIEDQAEWSQRTFGVDAIRGPIGALKHLKLEVDEILENPKSCREYADVLLLLLDANRRAGFTFQNLLLQAENKMTINKSRKWPAPVKDEPVLHIKGEDE